MGQITQAELDSGLIDIARRNHADWFARKHITDELYAECPAYAEACRNALRNHIMREFQMIDIIAGEKA